MDLFAPLGENLAEFGRFAKNRAQDGFEDEYEPIAAALCHIDSLLGNGASFGQEHLGILSFQGLDRLWLLILRWVDLEQVPHNGEVHEPRDPELEEYAGREDESEKGASAESNYINEKDPIAAMHS